MTITASPETDVAVARACGIDVENMRLPDGTPLACVSFLPFSPTTNLTHAFLAAEKFGLFYQRGFVLKEYGQGRWRFDGNDYGDDATPEQPTPALAICSAILTLAEKK